MNNNYFFSHDFNAHVDLKMVEIRMKYGWEGYGIFWALCEIISSNDKPIQESQIKGLAFNLHIDKEYLAEFIGFCIDIELFVDTDNGITSLSLERRLYHKREKSRKAKESAKKRWESKSKANAIQSQSECNANAEHKQSESNANKTKQNKTKPKQEISTKVDIVSKLTAQDQFKNEINTLFPSIDGFKVQDAHDFYDYWTEPDKKGKMLKDKQKTWDTSRRMKRWINNKNDNSNLQNKSKSFAEQEYDFKKDKVRENIEWIKEMQQARTLNMYEGDEVGKIN